MAAEKTKRNERMKTLREKGYTLQRIADKFHITRERVRQIVGNTGRLAKAGK